MARGRGLGRSRSHNGGRGPGGGAACNHGIRPRPQRGRRFRKLPRRHPVAPFKGEDLKGGRGWIRHLFSVGGHLRGKVSGLGLCVGGRWELGIEGIPGATPDKASSHRAGGRKGALWGWSCAPGPWAAGFFEPLLNPPVRGTPPPGVLGQRSNAASLPSIAFPKGTVYIQKSH